MNLPPLAAYIHIPWCLHKCPYCDFNSHTAGEALPEADYVTALLADLQNDLPWVQGRKLVSVFFGGGTPSLFSASALARILDGLERHVGLVDNPEITLEANPGTFEQAKFRDYRQLGINRLSIGIQSFQQDKLLALGRVHNANQALQAAEIARQAGFTNLNLDLMHGLPQQTVADALSDLRLALAQQPTHLSWYQLTLEPNTRFWSQPPTLPDDDLLWEIQETGQQLLAEQGFHQYETSAYAQTGQQARHNLNYWTFGDYLGLGAGAHAKLSQPDGRITRLWKTKQPKDYLNPAKPFQAGSQLLSAAQLPFEFLMNALRLTEGVPAQLFSERTSLPLEQLSRTAAQQRGLLSADPQRLVATAQGQLFLNDLLQIFL